MILVTGASGLLGANFILEAQLRKNPVVGIARNKSFTPKNIKIEYLDLNDSKSFTELIRQYQPDWIVHLAAQTNVDWCETNPKEANDINCEIARSIAHTAKTCGSRLLYMSTDAVFNGELGQYNESSTPDPANNYAKTKLAGEKAVLSEIPNALIVRSNIFGWNASSKKHLAEWIIGELNEGNTINGFTDSIFSPVLVNDLSNVFMNMMEAGLEGTYHVSSSPPISKYDFAVLLAEQFKLKPDLIKPSSVLNGKLSARRPLNTSLKTDKLPKQFFPKHHDIKDAVLQFKQMSDNGKTTLLKSWVKKG